MKRNQKSQMLFQNLQTMRHSAEHVLTQAMLELYPGIKMAMGPATEDGFYFDFEPTTPDGAEYRISQENFPKIEAAMKSIIAADLPFKKQVISQKKARELFKGNSYKLEWLDEIDKKGEKVSVFWTGNQFVDLCSGPHVSSTGAIGPFKLLSVAGAYWRGNEKNKMLTRIYGTVFKTQKELDHYLWQQAESKKRDHRKLAKELDLFTFSNLVGSGLPLYTPKGAIIRRLLNEYVEDIQSSQGYEQVWTPQINKADLFKISGHYDKYQENLFRVISNYSDEEFFLKPMNCPQHMQIYASKPRSYRDLPLRYTDFAMLYRDEKPGELNGLARVRSFSQDDCHVFCREDQVDAEVDRALSMIKKIMNTFGFRYRYRLSTHDPLHPEKYLGDPKTWKKVETWAEKIMKRNKIDYFTGPGEAAFYAPKMDLMATDVLGREWQLSTVQIDYFMPERFDLKYTDKNGVAQRPVVIHRAILGSTERFLMILLEHFAGAFPVWLSPSQVQIIPISQKHLNYAQRIAKALTANRIRFQINSDSESMQKRIRKAELQKIPYMLIIGDKEEKKKMVSVRARGENDLGLSGLNDFIKKIRSEIKEKI